MGGKMSRAKGQRGEREVIALLQPIVSQEFKVAGKDAPEMARNLDQYQKKGKADVRGVPWLALEVKYQETPQVGAWWKQTVDQASPTQEPVLIHRSNRQPWRVRMFGVLAGPERYTVAPVDITLEDFLAYFKGRVQDWLDGHDWSKRW